PSSVTLENPEPLNKMQTWSCSFIGQSTTVSTMTKWGNLWKGKPIFILPSTVMVVPTRLKSVSSKNTRSLSTYLKTMALVDLVVILPFLLLEDIDLTRGVDGAMG